LMSEYSNVIHLVGLGGAGTNIVEEFLKTPKTMDLLDRGASRLSMMALDIADPDIKSLEDTYNRVLDQMRRRGIPQDRLSLIARSIKFPSAEAMFDFVQAKFSEHLENEGVKLQKYHQWLPSTMAIPPLAGGAGRRRSLAKAIYNLNYYQLGIIKSFINLFKDNALSTITSPIILLVFGLGGGTGSGIALDFARHLRQAVGSGVPILGLCILPCPGDDPPAKGYSAYNALQELELVLNREKNEALVEALGETYRNPFNTLLFLPLMPAYNKTGNIVAARSEVDKMIVEVIYVLMDFDLADLMSGIGTEVGLTEDSIHALSMVKVNYPVDAYVEAFKSNLEKMQKLAEIRREKLAILDSLHRAMLLKKEEVESIYRDYLVKTNSYNAVDFEDRVLQLVRSNPRFEEDMSLYVKSVEDQVGLWVDEAIQFDLPPIQGEEGSHIREAGATGAQQPGPNPQAEEAAGGLHEPGIRGRESPRHPGALHQEQTPSRHHGPPIRAPPRGGPPRRQLQGDEGRVHHHIPPTATHGQAQLRRGEDGGRTPHLPPNPHSPLPGPPGGAGERTPPPRGEKE